jgi:hypothetical protein
VDTIRTTRITTKNICISSIQGKFISHLSLRISRDEFPEQHWPVDLYNADPERFLSDRNRIFKYYLQEIRASQD